MLLAVRLLVQLLVAPDSSIAGEFLHHDTHPGGEEEHVEVLFRAPQQSN